MNGNYCVVCGREIPEGMQVCKSCSEGEDIYPCDDCKRTEESERCWKKCGKFKKWFSKVWRRITEMFKQK